MQGCAEFGGQVSRRARFDEEPTALTIEDIVAGRDRRDVPTSRESSGVIGHVRTPVPVIRVDARVGIDVAYRSIGYAVNTPDLSCPRWQASMGVSEQITRAAAQSLGH
jgi:hypothetical protein